jgi:hypothetical protein
MAAVKSMPHDSFLGTRSGLLLGMAVCAFDAADGSFLLSMLVCPLWLLVSLVRGVWLRPGWGVALVRGAIPVAVLAVALLNDAFQRRLAMGRADQVVKAIGDYRDENGLYPGDLKQLVPKYLSFVPLPKNAIAFNAFSYSGGGSESHPSLWWVDIPPHGKRSYDFDEARWSYID